MGQLIDGVWTIEDLVKKEGDGAFKRANASLRNWITADGSPGPSGEGGFKAEAGRYHLYVSLACPWAHRTLIFRKLKGLEDMIGVSVVHWMMGDQGWTFETGDGATGDDLGDAGYMHQVYTRAHSTYTGRVTVPVLWDKERSTIVSNESSEIIRMLNSAFDGIGACAGDYYPEARRSAIDEINAVVYETVNNGVYRSGFATSQEAYEDAVMALFKTLDMLEQRLSSRRRVAFADHAPTLRSRLRRPLQVQSPAACRLSKPFRLCKRALSVGGRRGDRRLSSHQEPLLCQPHIDQSDADRAARPRHRLDPGPWPGPLDSSFKRSAVSD